MKMERCCTNCGRELIMPKIRSRVVACKYCYEPNILREENNRLE